MSIVFTVSDRVNFTCSWSFKRRDCVHFWRWKKNGIPVSRPEKNPSPGNNNSRK